MLHAEEYRDRRTNDQCPPSSPTVHALCIVTTVSVSADHGSGPWRGVRGPRETTLKVGGGDEVLNCEGVDKIITQLIVWPSYKLE